MEVEKRKAAISGNNALNTVVAPLPKERVKNPEINRQQREQRRQEKKAKVIRFFKFNGSILAVGVVGLTIVGRYGSIYSSQKEIISLQEQIHFMTEESEALSVKLLKYDNIAYIEEMATKELGMISPKSGEAVYVDMDVIESLASLDEATSTESSLFSKIKDFLFN